MGWFFNKQRADDMESRLQFSKSLQAVTNKIHATSNLDEIMLDLSKDICDLFNCDRLTLYAVTKDKDFIYSKVKTGINSNKDLVLPINAESVAGYVALAGCSVRIHDVYNNAELKAYAPDLSFNRVVDQLTGYRTKQMLAAPIFRAHSDEVLGVVQLLNNRADDSFTEAAETGLKELCETLAIAFTQRMKPQATLHSKYEPLVADAIISGPELELASRVARRKELDIEDVLTDDFQVPLQAIGQAMAKTFKLVYEPFKPDRIRPGHLVKKIAPAYAEKHQFLPIEEDGNTVTVITTDPKRVVGSDAVKQTFPYASVFYRVTTKREFRQETDLFFKP